MKTFIYAERYSMNVKRFIFSICNDLQLLNRKIFHASLSPIFGLCYSFCLLLLLGASSIAYGTTRDSSDPFISGDSFRTYCDFTFDELNTSIDFKVFEYGSTVFVKTDMLDKFLKKIHPQIPNPYIIVSHNSDASCPGKFFSYLDDPKIIGWFGQNLENCSHPKIHPIPIGLANRCWEHGNIDIVANVQKMKPYIEKDIFLYLNISTSTYPTERNIVAKTFSSKSFCYNATQKPFQSYLEDLARSKFVLSPRGNGLDCHRTWEALLMGAIPIVKTSSLDPLFENLPVLIVKDWSEINETFLHQSYKKMQSVEYHFEKLFIDYWLNLIDSYKTRTPIQCFYKKSAEQYSSGNAITYSLSGGRLGDCLLSYLHAKWLAHKYNLPFYFISFPSSDKFCLDRLEKKLPRSKHFVKKIDLNQEEDLLKHSNTLFVVPYFPEYEFEYATSSFPFIPHIKADWQDPEFHEEITKMLTLEESVKVIDLPENCITVGVHVRRGGGYDHPSTTKDYPLKFPSDTYYIEQLKKISTLFQGQPLYVYILTDDQHPLWIADKFKAALNNPLMTFDCRVHGNGPSDNIIEDFYLLQKFDCLILCQSNFSIVASKLGNYKVKITPINASTINGEVVIDEIEMIIN